MNDVTFADSIASLAAVAAFGSLLVSIRAARLADRATAATESQAKSAQEQVKAAQDQVKLMEDQLKAAQDQVSLMKEGAESEELKRRRAERPVFVPGTRSSGPHGFTCEYWNKGGAIRNLSVESDTPEAGVAIAPTSYLGNENFCTFSTVLKKPLRFTIKYRTMSGEPGAMQFTWDGASAPVEVNIE